VKFGWKYEMHVKFWWKNLNERENFGFLDAGGRINHFCKIYYVDVARLNWLDEGPIFWSCESNTANKRTKIKVV
jgi:hypothetical protein